MKQAAARQHASLRSLAVDAHAFKTAVRAQATLALDALATTCSAPVPSSEPLPAPLSAPLPARVTELSTALSTELVLEETRQCTAADAWEVDIDAALVALEDARCAAAGAASSTSVSRVWRVIQRIKASVASSFGALEATTLFSCVCACAPALAAADAAARLLCEAAAQSTAPGAARVRFLLQWGAADPSCDDNAAFDAALKSRNADGVRELLADPRVTSSLTPRALQSALQVSVHASDADLVAHLLRDGRVDPAAQDNAVIEQAATCLLSAHRRARKKAALVLAHLLRDSRVGVFHDVRNTYDARMFALSRAFDAAWNAWRESTSTSAREVNAPFSVLLGDASGRFDCIWQGREYYISSSCFRRVLFLRLMLDSPRSPLSFRLENAENPHAVRLLLTHPRTSARISARVLISAVKARFKHVNCIVNWNPACLSEYERMLCDTLAVLVNDARFAWDSDEFACAFADVAVTELVSHRGLRLLLDDPRFSRRARDAAVVRVEEKLGELQWEQDGHYEPSMFARKFDSLTATLALLQSSCRTV